MRRLVALSALIASPALAQQAVPSPSTSPAPASSSTAAYNHANAPVVHAARATGNIDIDGKLDEPAWSTAVPVTNFTQVQPTPGAPPSQRTEVRVLIGDDAIYIGAKLYDDPRMVRPRLTRKDEPVEGDIFAVAIDSRHDHLSAYYFRLTAGGALRDGVLTASQGGEGFNRDYSWDAVWQGKVHIDRDGWTAEMRIPLSQLPYNRTENPVWGIQFERYSWNRQEQDFLAFTPVNQQAGINRFGHLVGLGALPAPRKLELLPYASTRAELTHPAAGDPFRDGSDFFANVGGDLKYRMTSSLTLNATVNPDFGQVEVDPAVVNLTAFETFFPEKRPFFVEGQELFQFGQLNVFNSFSAPTLFFSRRVGRQPQRALDPASYAFADIPAQTTIAGAAKVTGKTTNGWTFGLLDAVTSREDARYLDGDGLRRQAIVEPLTNYWVGRVRREANAGNTLLGVFTSAVNRAQNDSVLDATLRSSGYVGGVDLNQFWGNRSWALDASIAGSHVRGTPDAIALTQLSSARYYQRPDAKSFSFDPTRSSLSGFTGQLGLTRAAALHWLGSLAYQVTSPGFESNDVGFQTRADRHALSSLIEYKESQPRGALLNWSLLAFANQAWNFDGNLVSNSYSSIAQAQFSNFTGASARVDYYVNRLNDRLTRGGPLAGAPDSVGWQLGYFTDRRKRYTADFNVLLGHDDAGQWSGSYDLLFAVQPSTNLRVSFEPNFLTLRSVAQYLTAQPDASATATFGTRYVFATLHEKQFSVTTRIDWTFSPTLSLQTFVQPLVDAQDYREFKQLRAPRTFDFDGYTNVERANGTVVIHPTTATAADSIVLPEPNANFRSLRGNAVLRWEYRPGSTLFFIWQQSRSGIADLGTFDFGRDYGALFRNRADNIFGIKLTYWFSP